MKRALGGKEGRRARQALLGGVLLTFCLHVLVLPPEAKLAPEANLAEYQLQVSFDLPQSKVKGKATIIPPTGRRLKLYLDELEVLSFRVNGRSLDLRQFANPTELEVAGGVVEITYEGVFQDPEGSVIDERGVILRDMWYPLVAGPCRYTLTATLPRDYEALSEADQITKSREAGTATFRFVFPHPLPEADGLTFAAFPGLQVSRTTYRDIELAAYFTPEHAGLAGPYLKNAREFLEMYERLLGPYPYRRLAIAESFQPSAYSMPTYILIGREELDLDEWGVPTLAHEVLHQWFGNSVFTDFDWGNWNEGLTIYLAEHFLMEQKGADWQCRRRILSGFKAHVNQGNDLPLRRFSEREDVVTRLVGYGKSAMVFHMLRRQVGDEAFFAGIRDFVREHSFRVASWRDLQKTFEKRTRQELSWFFSQWLNRVGLPDFRVEGAKVDALGNNFRVAVTLGQGGALYRLRLPVTFYRNHASQRFWITLTKEKDSFSFLLDFQPEELAIDETFEMFRKLTPEEDPATFERLFASGSALKVLPPVPSPISEAVTEAFQARGIALQIARTGEEDRTATKSATLLLLGRDHPLVPRLLGDLKLADQGFSAVIRKSPHAPESLAVVFQASDPKEVEASLKEMYDRPFYSDYVFQGGRLSARTLQETERGIRVKLSPGVAHHKDHPGMNKARLDDRHAGLKRF